MPAMNPPSRAEPLAPTVAVRDIVLVQLWKRHHQRTKNTVLKRLGDDQVASDIAYKALESLALKVLLTENGLMFPNRGLIAPCEEGALIQWKANKLIIDHQRAEIRRKKREQIFHEAHCPVQGNWWEVIDLLDEIRQGNAGEDSCESA